MNYATPGCNALIFLLDDMVIDNDPVLLSSPQAASNISESDSASGSVSNPSLQADRSNIGLVNRHPTMNGRFAHLEMSIILFVSFQQGLATGMATS